MANKSIENNNIASTFNQNQNNSKIIQSQKPYSLMKYQQTYLAASNKLIEFFTLHNIKKYIDYDKKSKFHKQLMEQILKQLRQFLRKKAAREFQLMTSKDSGGEEGLKLQEKFEAFDQIFFRSFIMEKLEQKQPKKIQVSPFEIYDAEDEILNQLQNNLAKIYSEL